uniref:THAP-type domain-containing protein n=1 Tax=Schizaphis graminum TaxID=13262 RepID=A0A2S2NYY9_SCHGA
MPRNCFVPHCHEGNKSQIKKNKLLGIKHKTMFKAPKDVLLLEKWSKAIQRTDRELRPGIDNVCEKHFDEAYVSRYFETKMPDGSINRIERGRLSLKKNAVPSIFPDLPQNLIIIEPIKKTKLNNISSTIDNVSETYNNLQDALKNMNLPTEWFFCCAHSSLLLGYLDSNYELIKKIIISSNDLNLKVFIKNNQVNITQTLVTCIDDIKKILKTVDDIKVCTETGIDNCTKSDQCCVECPKEKNFNMDVQGLCKNKNNRKPTTNIFIKNVYCNKQRNIKFV